jgi:hypothetical protein
LGLFIFGKNLDSAARFAGEVDKLCQGSVLIAGKYFREFLSYS